MAGLAQATSRAGLAVGESSATGGQAAVISQPQRKNN
jgi:hypothetical protein